MKAHENWQATGKPGDTGCNRVVKAAGYSAKCLSAAVRYEAAFRQELVIALAATGILPLLPATSSQKLLMWATLMVLLAVELLNSAIEAAVDRIGAEHHPLSGQAEDMGSAAVFICLLLCVGIWGGVLCQNLL